MYFFFLFNRFAEIIFSDDSQVILMVYSTCLATPGIFPGVDEILGVVTQLSGHASHPLKN
jgi:hypothetical protein